MCKKTGKASWISSFQKSSGLDASKKPQCSPHSDCKPAAEEPSIEMNGNGTHRELDSGSGVSYYRAVLPPYYVWIVN